MNTYRYISLQCLSLGRKYNQSALRQPIIRSYGLLKDKSQIAKEGNRLLSQQPINSTQVCQYINRYSHIMHHNDLINVFYRSTRKGVVLSDKEIHKIGRALKSVPICFTSRQISNLLYSVHKLNSSSTAIGALLTELSRRIPHAQGEFTGQSIGNCLYGLQNMSGNSPAVGEVLKALLLKMRMSKCILRPQECSNALYGLQKMHCGIPGVRSLLHLLAQKICAIDEKFSPLVISNSLYGLKEMTSRDLEVREVLKALAPHIRQCSDPFTHRDLGVAMYGLRHMSSTAVEVQSVIDSLAEKFELYEGNIPSSCIALILFGMSNMHLQHPPVRRLVSAISRHISSRPSMGDNVRAQEVGMMFSGLQNISLSSHGADMLLATLTDRYLDTSEESSRYVFNGIVVTSIFNGFFSSGNAYTQSNQWNSQVIGQCEVVTRSLSCFASKIMTSNRIEPLRLTPSQFCKCVYSLNHMRLPHPDEFSNSNKQHSELRTLLTVLCDCYVATASISSDIGIDDGSSAASRHQSKSKYNSTRVTLRDITGALWGVRGMSTEYPEVRRLMALIWELLQKVGENMSISTPSSGSFKTREICRIVCSLHDKSESHIVVSDILSFVEDIFENHTGENQIRLSPRQYRICMSGLNRMSLDSEHVVSLLHNLDYSLNLSSSDSDIWGFPISAVLSGLANMSNEHAIVRKTLKNATLILHRSITQYPGNMLLECMDIGNCYYSLRNMSSTYCMEEVSDLIRVLNTLLTNLISTQGKLDPSEIASITLGFQNINTDNCPVALETLEQLVLCLRDNDSVPEFEHSSHMVLGLSSSTGSSETVRSFLREVAEKMGSTNSSAINGMHAIQMLRGLQTLSTEYEEIVLVWDKLLALLESRQLDWSPTFYTEAHDILNAIVSPHSIHRNVQSILDIKSKR